MMILLLGVLSLNRISENCKAYQLSKERVGVVSAKRSKLHSLVAIYSSGWAWRELVQRCFFTKYLYSVLKLVIFLAVDTFYATLGIILLISALRLIFHLIYILFNFSIIPECMLSFLRETNRNYIQIIQKLIKYRT